MGNSRTHEKCSPVWCYPDTMIRIRAAKADLVALTQRTKSNDDVINMLLDLYEKRNAPVKPVTTPASA